MGNTAQHTGATVAPEGTAAAADFDSVQRFVRVCREREDGFIEFEFALGDPELCVELMLPETAFKEFCAANKVTLLEPHAAGGNWVERMNEATHREYGDTP